MTESLVLNAGGQDTHWVDYVKPQCSDAALNQTDQNLREAGAGHHLRWSFLGDSHLLPAL